MTNSTSERLKQIRENRRNFYGGMGELTSDIDFLLSLLDSEAAGGVNVSVLTGYEVGRKDEASDMRDRCVEKVKAMRDEWESKRNQQEPLSKMRNRYDAALCAGNEIITALQSLTLEQEQ